MAKRTRPDITAQLDALIEKDKSSPAAEILRHARDTISSLRQVIMIASRNHDMLQAKMKKMPNLSFNEDEWLEPVLVNEQAIERQMIIRRGRTKPNGPSSRAPRRPPSGEE